MSGFGLFHHTYWQPFSYIGITHPLLTIQLDLVLTTWLVIFLLILFALGGRYALKHPDSLLYTAYMALIRGFMALVEQSWNGKCPERYFLMITTFFLFILTCNWLMLLGLEEPTANYNTTLTLALISFFYIQKETLRHHGLKNYLQEYFKMPFSISSFSLKKLPLILLQCVFNIVAAVALFPLELMSKVSSILSLSFRLFGNILAGSIVFSLYNSLVSSSWLTQLLGLIIPVNIIILGFFGIFEGIIQAFVFTILTTTYLSLATTTHASE